MSSSRKRSAIQKAQNETNQIRQQLILAEHHANVMQSFAKMAAERIDSLLHKLDNLTDDDLTAIYKRANEEDEGKSKPLTTERIFNAMRATAKFIIQDKASDFASDKSTILGTTNV